MYKYNNNDYMNKNLNNVLKIQKSKEQLEEDRDKKSNIKHEEKAEDKK